MRPPLYAAGGSALSVVELPTGDSPASLEQSVWMPGVVERIAFNDATQLRPRAGPDAGRRRRAPSTSSSRAATRSSPTRPPLHAGGLGHRREQPTTRATDRQQLLALRRGRASQRVGRPRQNAFAWRVPGVVAGALDGGAPLPAGARSSSGAARSPCSPACFVLADGMLFAQSRIAMNDAYVALFIMAAVAVFAAIWTGAWRWRGAFWVGLPMVGLLLGLALASKWVALYAIGGIGLLILAPLCARAGSSWWAWPSSRRRWATWRSPRAREATSGGNLVFLLLMIALTLVAVAVSVLHPVAWTVEEVRIAVGRPGRGRGAIGWRSSPLGLGIDAHGAGRRPDGVGGAAAGRILAGRAPRPRAARPAARARRPGRPAGAGRAGAGGMAAARLAGGFPIVWAAVCLLGIPVAVYVGWLPAVGRPGQPDRDRVPGRERRTDAGRPHPRHVRLPQQPAGDPRGGVAVVGLAART